MALSEARRRLPAETWQRLIEQLGAGGDASPDPAAMREVAAGLLNQDVVWRLSAVLAKQTAAKGNEIAAAMMAVDCLASDTQAKIEIIWTGPANGRFPVRRTDQVEQLFAQACQGCARQACAQAVEKELRYFLTNVERMQYGAFRPQRLFIGSGVVEAGAAGRGGAVVSGQ